VCGIAGIVSLAPGAAVDADALRTMAAQLVHRGPDDEGYYVDATRCCGLAFRRLSIIDVAGGRQPIATEDGAIQVVFNGEIYNFRELRAELEQCGHRFTTRSDSEVIAHLYEQHGERCFQKLAGMFAIAIWDGRRRRLVLVRDRFGKKPLTYAVHEGRLYFASEAKAILALPGFPREIDPQSLHRYLLFQYVAAPHSIFRGFRKLPPAHFLVLAAEQGRVAEPIAYYALPRPPRFDGRYRDAKQRLGELLTRAVERRLISDVPLGAFLSGGVDSSIVVALMYELGVSPLRTFSIGFPDWRYDETAYASRIAGQFKTEHHEHIVTPQAREVLEKLAWHYDEPFADSSAIPTYYVSHWTRQHVTVALTGDGGDECFAGYDRYRAARLSAMFDSWPRSVRGRVARLAGDDPPLPRTLRNRAYRFLRSMTWDAPRRYLSWVAVFQPDLLESAYTPEFAARIDRVAPIREFETMYASSGGDVVERAIRTDFAGYLPYDLLTKVDIASMACSLECRAPFLDHELVEFALSLPIQWRLGRGARGGKRILRDWARTRLPHDLLDRPKMGFGVPIGRWLRDELADLLIERVLAEGSLSRRIFRSARLEEIVGAHLAGAANYEHPLWALLMLELWHDRWRSPG
jgi:asparagine synthase (glutamine-hydrolysing)